MSEWETISAEAAYAKIKGKDVLVQCNGDHPEEAWVAFGDDISFAGGTVRVRETTERIMESGPEFVVTTFDAAGIQTITMTEEVKPVSKTPVGDGRPMTGLEVKAMLGRQPVVYRGDRRPDRIINSQVIQYDDHDMLWADTWVERIRESDPECFISQFSFADGATIRMAIRGTH